MFKALVLLFVIELAMFEMVWLKPLRCYQKKIDIQVGFSFCFEFFNLFFYKIEPFKFKHLEDKNDEANDLQTLLCYDKELNQFELGVLVNVDTNESNQLEGNMKPLDKVEMDYERRQLNHEKQNEQMSKEPIKSSYIVRPRIPFRIGRK